VCSLEIQRDDCSIDCHSNWNIKDMKYFDIILRHRLCTYQLIDTVRNKHSHSSDTSQHSSGE